MGRVHVARQAIFDRDLRVHGYELLFRDRADALRSVENGDAATTRVIVNTVTEFGLERLVGDRLAFLNMTRPFLVGSLPLPVEPGHAVLEVLETVRLDDEVVAGVHRLAAKGYAIALDDVLWTPDVEGLLDVSSYAKLDMAAHTPESLAATAQRFLERGVQCLGERVETPEQLALAREVGCTYFQGHVLAHPDVLSATALGPEQAACMDLLGRLSDPDADVDDVEHIVRLDVALSYRLLGAANSSAAGLHRRVSSVREALVMLGLSQLRSWVLLLVLASSSPASREQLTTALARARTCELLAPRIPGVRPESAFMVGLLSHLDVLLGAPLTEVMERLPIDDTPRAALLNREGPLGRLLDVVLAYEQADMVHLDESPIDLYDLGHAYLTAVAWSLQTYGNVVPAEGASVG